ncbi:alcohol dehydrogenase catalytic domain-containing protein [Rhodococcus hoagii]|nr:alcohol dehydrogenase catalytic domain-containing protein [Prescottella equi]
MVNPHDAIVEVRLTTTCGSDLHFIDGYLPGMREGDVFGHEFMGEVVETGPEVTRIRTGTRVGCPRSSAAGRAGTATTTCRRCATHQPQCHLQQTGFGLPNGGIYGYTHPFGATRLARRVHRGACSPTPIASRCPTGYPTSRPVPLRCGADRLHGCRLLRHLRR